jgi:hypothetical protein
VRVRLCAERKALKRPAADGDGTVSAVAGADGAHSGSGGKRQRADSEASEAKAALAAGAAVDAVASDQPADRSTHDRKARSHSDAASKKAKKEKKAKKHKHRDRDRDRDKRRSPSRDHDRTGDVGGADRRAQVTNGADDHHGKSSAPDEYAVGYHENNMALE